MSDTNDNTYYISRVNFLILALIVIFSVAVYTELPDTFYLPDYFPTWFKFTKGGIEVLYIKKSLLSWFLIPAVCLICNVFFFTFIRLIRKIDTSYIRLEGTADRQQRDEFARLPKEKKMIVVDMVTKRFTKITLIANCIILYFLFTSYLVATKKIIKVPFNLLLYTVVSAIWIYSTIITGIDVNKLVKKIIAEESGNIRDET